MFKIRITATEKEMQQVADKIKETFDVLEMSKQYNNRNSEYVRIYAECELKQTTENSER